MSMIGEAFSALRRLVLMDSEVQRMTAAIDRTDARLDDHQDRLVRIEVLIELSGRGGPPPLSRR